MTKEIAVSVYDLHKSFRLPTEKSSSLKQAFLNRMRGIKGYKEQKVLKGLSFEIEKGDFFGIVGRNGSGKSTLLKLLAGIYVPDRGGIKVNGSLVPFIELGVGFNPELTGRENVYLNGALLGFSNEEIDEMYDEIVDFAELHEFMGQKLKNYSSGMQVRLAFSIAIKAQGDILVLDEVLAVGDEAFQRKCYTYFAELKRNKKTVILVTHGMDSVQQFCNKAILISDGEIIESGNPAKVAGGYMELNNQVAEDKKNKGSQKTSTNNYGLSAIVKHQITKENIIFDIGINAKQRIYDAVVAFMINRDTGEMVYRWTTDDKYSLHRPITIKEGAKVKIRLNIENIFPDGGYDVQLMIKKIDRSVNYAIFNQILVYQMTNPNVHRRGPHWKPNEEFEYEQN